MKPNRGVWYNFQRRFIFNQLVLRQPLYFQSSRSPLILAYLVVIFCIGDFYRVNILKEINCGFGDLHGMKILTEGHQSQYWLPSRGEYMD